MARYVSIEEYLAGLDPAVAAKVQHVREILTAAVPNAQETIAYDMPTLTLDGQSLVHFAGWKKHLSLYPEPDGDAALHAELAPYANGRGTLTFPYHESLPDGLLERIVHALVAGRRAR